MWQRSITSFRYVRAAEHYSSTNNYFRDSKLSKWPVISHHSCRYLTVKHSNNQEAGKSAMKKLVTMIKSFTLGTKSLYYDVKRMRQLQKAHGKLVITEKAPLTESGRTNYPFKLEEVQFIYQTKKDLVRMLPTVTLFMVPLVGYVAPLIAFMFPQHLLSHQFWTDDLKKELEQKEFNTRIKHVRVVLQELANNTSFQLLKQQLHSNEDAMATLNISPHMERSELATLSVMWGLFPWLPKSYLQKRLVDHMNYIFLCDWLLKQENNASISEKDIARFCVERCLPDKEHAAKWVKVSTQYKECPKSLLAYLPGVFN